MAGQRATDPRVAAAVREGVVTQVGPFLRHAIEIPQVRGITYQRATWSGRFDAAQDPLDRLTAADVIRLIAEQSGDLLAEADFEPLPCGDPNCCAFRFVARQRRGAFVPLTRLVRFEDHVEQLADRMNFNLADAGKCCGVRWRVEDYFRVVVKPFMDRYTYDQARIDECCIHIIQLSGTAMARGLLQQPDAAAVLVDIRPRNDFATGHLNGAVNWPHAEPAEQSDSPDLPAALPDKTLLLIDGTGWESLFVAARLRQSGAACVHNVRGGIQEWIRSVSHQPPGSDRGSGWQIGDGAVRGLPFREPVLADAVVSVTAFFVIKPIYTLLSLLVIVLLWRETSADLAALRWGMIFFFVGENACALNVLGFHETSHLLEYLHSAGMAVCLGFVAYAVMEGLDRRVIGLSAANQRCAATNLCGKCIKHADVPCGLRRLFTMLIPLLIVVACMLPTADWHDTAYNTTVFGQFYPYGHLRVLMVSVYSESLAWFGFWEEMTELLLLAGICVTLWTFRVQLLPAWQRWLRLTQSSA